MNENMKQQLQEFFTKCYARLDQQSGPKAERYKSTDLFEEISQELADVANYAFLEFLKLTELREKTEKYKASSG